MSIAGGVHHAPLRGREVGCEAIQIFTKSNRQWRARPLDDVEVRAFRRNLAAARIEAVVAHACYLLNLAAPTRAVWRRSVVALREELERAERLGVPFLVTHPGSGLGAPEVDSIARVSEAVNRLHADLPRHRVRILLETTAGQGTSLGHWFEQLAAIVEQVEAGHRVGICLDSCHLFAAGYDFRTADGYRRVMRALATCLGVARVQVIHLNDSQQGLGSRVDRHAHIGHGQLGLTAFTSFLTDPNFRRVPMILETPKGDDAVAADRRNLARLRTLVNGVARAQRS